MPFENGSFDCILCQQGLQYFTDRQAGINEMARVLAPGGRVSLNVWGTMERQVFFVALVDAIGIFLNDQAKSAFDLAYSLNTCEQLHELSVGAGLREAEVRIEHRTIRAPSVAEFAMGFMQASPLAGQYLALTGERKAEFGGTSPTD